MPIIIHPGKCDQAKECECPEVCVDNAWCRDAKDKTWYVDEAKCTDCGLCVHMCPAGAVTLVTSEKEKEQVLDKIKKDIKHTPETLFVERYGGMPIKENIVLNAANLEAKTSLGIIIVEFFHDDSIKCLVKAPPYHEFAPDYQVYKVDVGSEPEIKSRFLLKKFPSLVLFKNGEELGRIEGFLGDVEEIKARLDEFVY